MEITAEIQAAIDDAVAGLKAKNTELIGEVKKLRKGQEIDPEDFNRLKEDNDALADKLAETQKAVKAAQTEAEKLKKAYADESGFTQKLLVDNGLTEALVKNGIAPQFLSAVKALFAGQTQVVTEGDSRSAKIGDKSLTEFVTDWSKTDEGKHFVAAPANSGGGSNGGRGHAGTADLSGLKPTDRINAARAAQAQQ
jgi:regulator of replication initiation timing